MANRFLEFYNDELRALRQRATRFADNHPKIAGRLRLARGMSDDPHVERLIQSFAFSSARIRQKLDDSLPELTDGMIETLYPHYLAPVPAMTVVGMTPARQLDHCQNIPRGTEILSEQVDGDQVRFVTTQDVELAPVKIETARIMNRPLEAPQRPDLQAAGALRLTLAPSAKVKLNELGLTKLRLYLSAAQPQAMALFQLCHQHCVGMSMAAHSGDPEARHYGAERVTPVGHAEDEALLPYPQTSFRGYRTLTEFFTLPEKYLFFDIALGPIVEADRLDIYLYFNEAPAGLERQIDASAFSLFAAPVVNLFTARAEPINLDGTRATYPLQADSRRAETRAVHSVRHVTLAGSDGSTREAKPYFHHLTERGTEGVFWQLRRYSTDDGARSGSTSLFFVDTRNEALVPTEETASVEVLATNHTLPQKLPYGGGQPRLTARISTDQLAGIACLLPLTPPRHSTPSADRAWELVSHLSLNHLSLTRGGTPVLRNILQLYDPRENRETARLIEAIDKVETTPGYTRMGQVMVPGTDIELTFDEDRIEPAKAVFFGAALDRFFGCYTSLNSFTRLTLKLSGRSDVLAAFPARAGEEALI
ncbi:type VI secretion system baseplate subunit TssF [Paracoccaceae bacterium GXU_MW_L88]